MVAKAVFLFCAQALMFQSIAGHCIGAGWAGAPLTATHLNAAPWAAAPCAAPFGAAGLYETTLLAPAAATASNGGSLPISSGSAIPPNGVSIASENAYAGELAVRGALPFLGTVGLEGALPTAGAAAVAYGCGNGQVAMLTEDIGATGIAGPLALDGAISPFPYRTGGLGFEAGLARPFTRAGCGSLF